MDRRNFFRAGLAAGAATLVSRTGATEGHEGHIPGPVAGDFELTEVTIANLQESMTSGRLTGSSITEAYRMAIEGIDAKGPALHSVLEVNPDAPVIAEKFDRARKEEGPLSSLHGIPILLKDNIDTADRMTTTAGSLALEGSIPAQDATVALRLRRAGAILLGKTNLSEWANFRSEHSSSGWSARGGQCRNPYVLDRNPCGSSSGSGAAVAANLAAAAIGTETDGSIVCPSNANGLVGLKPTVGLVSRAGIIPISHTQDTAGPMTRTVADAAVILGAIAGVDPRDAATATAEGHIHADYTRFLDAGGLKGARIGVARQYFGFNRDVDEVMAKALAVLEKQGAVLVDPVKLTPDSDIGEAEYTVLLYEFKAGLNGYLESLGAKAPVKSLAEIIAFNEKHADREMPYFGQEIFLKAEAKGPLTEPEYLEALARCRRLSREEGIDKVLAEHQLDAIAAPTGGPAWCTDLVNGDHFGGGCSTLPAVAGYPHITVPAGFVRGLPVGISFFAGAWSEPTLIRLAYAFEQATHHRRAPEFLTAAEL